mgnify:CR=1 FL=1
MNYSEMVGRYAAKIEWLKKPMGGDYGEHDRIW